MSTTGGGGVSASTESGLKAYLVFLGLEMSNHGVFRGRLAFEEKVLANGPAADMAGGGVRRHADANELLDGGADGRPELDCNGCNDAWGCTSGLNLDF